MKEPTIIVCIKQVPDPEGPDSAFEIDTDAKCITARGIPPVLNSFDAKALEVALALKDELGGQVIALNMVDDKLAMPVLKKALAVGADELFILKDERFTGLDSLSTAYVLSAAIKEIGEYDLILVGRQSADWGFGQVGPMLAEMQQIASVGVVQRVKMEGGDAIVERLKRNGHEVLRIPLPVVVSMDSDMDLRLPTLKDIRDVGNKPVTTWGASDIKVDLEKLEMRQVYELLRPPSKNRKCFMIEGETMQEKGENLALKLRSDGVI
jgi:electron transfer flavoprotein beta subunit